MMCTRRKRNNPYLSSLLKCLDSSGEIANYPTRLPMICKPVLLSAFLILVTTFSVTAETVGPPAGYELDPEYNLSSPDKATRVEQYANVSTNGDYSWESWAQHKGVVTLLEPEQPYYPAGFRFTSDSQWLVRVQKTGSGESTLYLYHLSSGGFITATPQPLGNLAWDFFNCTADGKKCGDFSYHLTTYLVKGTEENYRWLDVHWPDSRYLIIGLSGEGERWSLKSWWCRYDLQKGTFDVPAQFARNNLQAFLSKAP